jgi:hypothetical protein
MGGHGGRADDGGGDQAAKAHLVSPGSRAAGMAPLGGLTVGLAQRVKANGGHNSRMKAPVEHKSAEPRILFGLRQSVVERWFFTIWGALGTVPVIAGALQGAGMVEGPRGDGVLIFLLGIAIGTPAWLIGLGLTITRCMKDRMLSHVIHNLPLVLALLAWVIALTHRRGA